MRYPCSATQDMHLQALRGDVGGGVLLFVETFEVDFRPLQGYLPHKKTPTTLGPPRNLGIGLLKDPRGGHSVMSEVTL